MDDAKLRAAAKLSEAEFNTEWLNQGGSNDPTHMGINFNYFKNVRAGLFSKKPNESVNRLDNTTFMGVAERMMKTQIRPEAGDKGELQSIDKGLSAFFTDQGKFRGWKNSLKEMGALLIDEVELHLQQQNDLLEEINKKTSITGKLSHEFRQEIMDASKDAIKLGISFDSFITSISTLVAESGKFRLLSKDTMDQMALASVFVGSMEQFAAMGKDFEAVGLGARDAAREIDAVGHRSLEVGLNTVTSTKMVDENLSRLNQYGFKTGVEGLNQMVRKSIEFRTNMSDTFNFAEKVWSPEQALGVVSNLQMIGGAFGDLNDPIKLMYMATNNVEGLQDALIDASKTLVTFNKEQGRFEVTGVNLRRAKEMADQFGMSMQDLNKTAVAAMERTQAASDLLSTGLIMNDKDREFLTNLAQMKEGRMVIEVPTDLRKQLGVSAENTAIALDTMTEEQTKTLLEQRDAFKKLTTEDFARQQVSVLQNINRDVSFIRATLRIGVGRVIGEAAEKYLGFDANAIEAESKNIRNIVGGTLEGWESSVLGAMNKQGMNMVAKGTVGEPKTENMTAEQIKAKVTEREYPMSFEEFKKSGINVYHKHEIGVTGSLDEIGRYMMKLPDKTINPKSYEVISTTK